MTYVLVMNENRVINFSIFRIICEASNLPTLWAFSLVNHHKLPLGCFEGRDGQPSFHTKKKWNICKIIFL
jgi:hypothetical protein